MMTDTDTENTLAGLRASLELNPGDEVARLALADLLEEQEDEKAAAMQRRFIPWFRVLAGPARPGARSPRGARPESF